MFKCVHCERTFTNKGGQFSHQPFCKNNPDYRKREKSPNSGAKKGRIPWNKGIKTPQEVKDKISSSLKGICKGVASSESKEAERRNKISETMKKNPNSGGLRKGSGRGKKGWYGDFWCDSTWELAWVIYNVEHDIKFERNKKGFKYIYNNKEHIYYPDFKLDNKFIEIKGRRKYFDLSEKDKAKIESFQSELTIIFEPDMKIFLEYVTNKYGKDFYKMYNK
jgi:hypothetical protein